MTVDDRCDQVKPSRTKRTDTNGTEAYFIRGGQKKASQGGDI